MIVILRRTRQQGIVRQYCLKKPLCRYLVNIFEVANLLNNKYNECVCAVQPIKNYRVNKTFNSEYRLISYALIRPWEKSMKKKELYVFPNYVTSYSTKRTTSF